MDDVTQRLTKCFETVFPDLPAAQIPAATQASVEAWDSVAAIMLANVVSDEFGLTVDFERLGELTSFDSIRKWVQAA